MSNKKPYTVLAKLEAKPGKEKELESVLASLITPTVKEEGCLNYDFHRSLENPATFMFYENWSSKEAHAKHSESAHIQTAQSKIQDLLAKPFEVSFWEVHS